MFYNYTIHKKIIQKIFIFLLCFLMIFAFMFNFNTKEARAIGTIKGVNAFNVLTIKI